MPPPIISRLLRHRPDAMRIRDGIKSSWQYSTKTRKAYCTINKSSARHAQIPFTSAGNLKFSIGSKTSAPTWAARRGAPSCGKLIPGSARRFSAPLPYPYPSPLVPGTPMLDSGHLDLQCIGTFLTRQSEPVMKPNQTHPHLTEHDCVLSLFRANTFSCY